MKVFDVSHPMSADIVESFEEVKSTCSGIFITGDYLFLAAAYDGLFILNIHDPTDLIKLGHYSVLI